VHLVGLERCHSCRRPSLDVEQGKITVFDQPVSFQRFDDGKLSYAADAGDSDCLAF
jgi:hypothetical protein